MGKYTPAIEASIPKIRRLLGRTAVEALDLAARRAPDYAAHGIVIHYLHTVGRQSLPPRLYADPSFLNPLSVAFQSAAGMGFAGWADHGRPPVSSLRTEEPEWLRKEVDFVMDQLKLALVHSG